MPAHAFGGTARISFVPWIQFRINYCRLRALDPTADSRSGSASIICTNVVALKLVAEHPRPVRLGQGPAGARAIHQHRLMVGRRCFGGGWHWQRGTRRLLGERYRVSRRCRRPDRCFSCLAWGLRRDRRCVWLPRGFRADRPGGAFLGVAVRRRRLRKRRYLFGSPEATRRSACPAEDPKPNS